MSDQKMFRALREALLGHETSLAKKIIVRKLDELYADGFQGTAIVAALKEILNSEIQMFEEDV
jgi:hypothetical protein